MPGEYSQATLAAHFEETNRRLAGIKEQLMLVSEKVGLPYTTLSAAVPPTWSNWRAPGSSSRRSRGTGT